MAELRPFERIDLPAGVTVPAPHAGWWVFIAALSSAMVAALMTWSLTADGLPRAVPAPLIAWAFGTVGYGSGFILGAVAMCNRIFKPTGT